MGITEDHKGFANNGLLTYFKPRGRGLKRLKVGVGIWRIMKRVLAISNLIAASLLTLFLLLPLVLAHVAKPIGDSGAEGIIIGGTDGPTAIFLSSEPSILALTFVILMAGLLFWNAHTMWKER